MLFTINITNLNYLFKFKLNYKQISVLKIINYF